MKTLFATLVFLFATGAIPAQNLHLQVGSTYLGCLTCYSTDPISVWNDVGEYGSPYGQYSIFNSVGMYGSDVGLHSPFNPVSSSPPVVVDEAGNFYGFLTINSAISNRATFLEARKVYNYAQ